MEFLRKHIWTLIKYIILGIVCLGLLLSLIVYYRLTRPQVCCSCLCQTSGGDECSGIRSQGESKVGCAKICKEACETAGCNLKEASVINEGKCSGGLIPFL
jgi:hypothetical protein